MKTFLALLLFAACAFGQYSDDFNRSDGSPGANWTGAVGTWAISSNRLVQTRGPQGYAPGWHILHSVSSAWDGVSVQAAMYKAGLPDSTTGLIARYSNNSGQISFYVAYIRQMTGLDEWRMYKYVQGTYTQIGSTLREEFTSGSTVRFEVTGSTLTMYLWNGSTWVTKLTGADSDLVSGSVGLRASHQGAAFDDFYVATAGSGSTPVTPAPNTIPQSAVTNLVSDLAARVVGPASSTDGALAQFDGITGKLLKQFTGTGLLKATSGVPGVVTGTGTDCVLVNGSSQPCATGSGNVTGTGPSVVGSVPSWNNTGGTGIGPGYPATASAAANSLALRNGNGDIAFNTITANSQVQTPNLLAYPTSDAVSANFHNGPGTPTLDIVRFLTYAGTTLSAIDKDGNFTGRANTASALSANPANCSAGQAAAGIAADGSAEGCFTPSGGGGSAISGLTDCKVTYSSGSVVNIGACSAQVDNYTPAVTSACSTSAAPSSSGTLRVYIAQDGTYTLGYSGANTATCTGWTTATSISAFPTYSQPIATITWTSGSWNNDVTDLRRLFRPTPIAPGADMEASTINGLATVNPSTVTIPRKSNIQSGALLRCLDPGTGSDDTYTCTMSPTLASYTDGMIVNFAAPVSNTGAATLQIDSIPTAVSIKRCDGSTDPADADIAANRPIQLTYDGTVFRLPCNPATVSGGGSTISISTFASLPGTCTEGNLYLLSNSLYAMARCGASNTYAYFADGKQITRIADVGSWTSVGTAGTLTETYGYTTMVEGASGMWGRYIAAPSAPYTRVAMFRGVLPYNNFASICFGLRQGSGGNAGRAHALCLNYGSGTMTSSFLDVRRLDTSLAYSSGDGDTVAEIPAGLSSTLAGGYTYFRIEDDSTNLIFSWSLDGNTFNNLATVARGAWIDQAATPQLFIGISPTGDADARTVAHWMGFLQ